MKDTLPVNKTIAFVSHNGWTMYNFRMQVLEHLLVTGYRVLIFAEEDRYMHLLISLGCRFIPVTIDNRSWNPLHDIRLFVQLKKLYRKWRPDFIFHYVAKPNIYGTLAAGALHIPSVAVITGLGHAFNKRNLLRITIEQMYRFALRYAYEVWCLNREDAELLVKRNIVSVQKLKVLPGEGVNINHFKKTGYKKDGKAPFTFLMSARLLKSKGILDYADATLILQKKNYVFTSFLLGAQENHPDAVTPGQIDKWQHERGIRYLGFTDDVRRYLEEADCFVYPSFYNEGVPRSLLEACSMELPVITTNNTGCRDLVQDGVNGFICNKQERFQLAEKMEAMLLLQPLQRKQMGMEGRRMVAARYSTEQVIAFYEQLLQTYFAVT